MLICTKCNQPSTKLSWLRDRDGWCPTCFHSGESINQSAMIATDSIPGGLEIKHGLCNADGSPRRFDSKTDIKRAAYEAGYTISGDTPKPNSRLVEQRAMEAEQRRSGIPGLRSR